MRAILSICLLPIAVVAAREEKEPGISARFRALAFSAPIPDAAYAISDDERVPLLITSSFMTGEQRYRGPARVRFTHLAKDLVETPLAEVELSDQSKVILLFAPDDNGGQRIRVLRDVDGDFPWGTLRFINLTGWRVRVVSGNQTTHLDLGADRVVRPAAAHRQYAMTEIQVERDGGFGRAYLMRTFQEDDLRTLYFLLPGDPVERTVVLKGIEERKGDESAPPPETKPISLRLRDAQPGPNGRPAALPINGRSSDARR